MPASAARVLDAPALATPSQTPAPTSELATLFAKMVEIRTVETALLDLFAAGRLRGTVHTCLGQEAIAAGIVGALDLARDAVCSNHRGHGHYLAYCGDIVGLVAEIMGRPDGVCGGIGGSQHLHRGNFYSNGILGGMSPVAAGIALAEKRKGSGAITVVFHGDGAMAEGAIAETMNLAALWDLPLLIAIESNGVAQSTPIAREIAGDLVERGRAVGIATSRIDGNDVLAVHGTARRLVHEIRSGGGPRMIVCDSYRLGPHSKGDDDRDPNEIEAARRLCPIERARARLGREAAEIEARVADEVAAALARLA
jgi:TPP-dependent pyruvate/acetoin dehydrogenase alpha subunit